MRLTTTLWLSCNPRSIPLRTWKRGWVWVRCCRPYPRCCIQIICATNINNLNFRGATQVLERVKEVEEEQSALNTQDQQELSMDQVRARMKEIQAGSQDMEKQSDDPKKSKLSGAFVVKEDKKDSFYSVLQRFQVSDFIDIDVCRCTYSLPSHMGFVGPARGCHPRGCGGCQLRSLRPSVHGVAQGGGGRLLQPGRHHRGAAVRSSAGDDQPVSRTYISLHYCHRMCYLCVVITERWPSASASHSKSSSES